MKQLLQKLSAFTLSKVEGLKSLPREALAKWGQFRRLSTPLKLTIPVILLLSTVLITSIIEQRQDQRGRAAQCDNPGQSSEHNPNCITPTEEPTSIPQPTTEPTAEQPTSIPPTDVPTAEPTTVATATPTSGGVGGNDPTATPISTTTPTNTPTPSPTSTPTPVPVGGSNTTTTYVVVTSAPSSTGQSPTTATNQTTTTTRGQTNIIIKITQTPTPEPNNQISTGQTGQNIQISPIYTVQIPPISKDTNLFTYFFAWFESLLKFFEVFTTQNRQ